MKKTILVITLLLANIVTADLIYNDGQIYNISSDYSGYVGHIYDSGTEGPTTVNMNTGSSYDELYAWDYSYINVYDGTIHEQLGARNNSLIEVHDGSIQKIAVNDSLPQGAGNARVDIFGGSIWLLEPAGGESYVHGGSVLRIATNKTSWVKIEDGSVNEVDSYVESEVEIIGGSIDVLSARDSSTITLYGTNFNYDYGLIDVSFGTLQGTLMNGDTIDADFYIYSQNASIILVPEPTTLLLLGLGVPILSGLRRK